MKSLNLLVGLFIISTFITLPNLASAKKVAFPVPPLCAGGDPEVTIDFIKNKTETCEHAAVVARECAWGSGMDTAIAGEAQKKCEKDFISQMSKDEKAEYNRRNNVCKHKYNDEEGTMYVAMRAHCALDVAEHFSKEFLKLQEQPCACATGSSQKSPAVAH